jgi:acyl carrier protein
MALTVDEVLAGIKEIVVEVAGIDANIIAMDKKFTDDLDVDSLSMVEVVVAAEEKFGVTQVEGTSPPSGVVAPSPVTTTRRRVI